MWSETIGYREYRHPYLKRFFPAVARSIPLAGSEDLLDLGCGTGEVALGFAPHVGTLTGLDLEQPMLTEAAKRARALGRDIRLINAKVEDAPLDLGRFHLITMGRAHWFMHSPATLARLDRWLTPGGRIMICRPVTNPEGAEWQKIHLALVNKWARGDLLKYFKLTIDDFFAGAAFVPEKRVLVRGSRKLELEHLVYRTLGIPGTTRAILGDIDADRMIAEIRAAMAPYFRNGPIVEQHATVGFIYRRRGDT